MPWLHRGDPHLCDQPQRSPIDWWPTPEEPKCYAAEGSIWQCDECEQYWRAERFLWVRWQRITPGKARRILKQLEKAGKLDG